VSKSYTIKFSFDNETTWVSTGIADPDSILNAFRKQPLFGAHTYTIESSTSTFVIDLRKVTVIKVKPETEGEA